MKNQQQMDASSDTREASESRFNGRGNNGTRNNLLKLAADSPRRLWRWIQRADVENGKYDHLEIYGTGIIKLKDEYLASREWEEKVKRVAKALRKRLEQQQRGEL